MMGHRETSLRTPSCKAPLCEMELDLGLLRVKISLRDLSERYTCVDDEFFVDAELFDDVCDGFAHTDDEVCDIMRIGKAGFGRLLNCVGEFDVVE
mmetsp:Transcript_78876/g.123119  ORF Transcript_78876/g.123119 Transcript_78876/m.123119 type:complete len:95 (+) Transcript_78876:336-620(+)